MAHIVLSSFGSLGDLHPYLALGLGLQRRGHRVTIATSEFYHQKIGEAGLGFHAARPHFEPNDPELSARVMDRARGTEYIFKTLVMPHVRDTYQDLLEAVRTADLFVSGSLVYVASAVAATSGVKWVSSALQPLVFFSAHDPPVLPNLPFGERLARLGPAANRAITRLGKRITWPWTEPLRTLRLELGLPDGPHPLYEGQHAPRLVLGLFSSSFAPPQRDWPPQSEVTGFLFYDQSEALSDGLERFLAAGDAPLVFTLGSAAVYAAGDFYAESLKAARALRRHSVLLTGKELSQQLPKELLGEVLVADYAPYAALFPRAALLVHQGGIGTTAEALRAGRPMLVTPFAHDQPDNAYRVRRLGSGLSLARGQYRAKRVIPLLERLLNDPSFAAGAKAASEAIRAEDSLTRACDALERVLSE